MIARPADRATKEQGECTDQRPSLLGVRPGGIPMEMKGESRWLMWRLEWRVGKWTKVPYTIDGAKASSTNPATWTTFDAAVRANLLGGFDGIGFALGSGWVGVDLDHAVAGGGTVEPWAAEIVSRLNSYSERSVSGTGLHVICKGTLPPNGRRREGLEMYDAGRYFTVSGHREEGALTTVEHRDDELAAVHVEHIGASLSRTRPQEPKGPRANTGSEPSRFVAACKDAKFAALYAGDTSGYPSQSEADAAFCVKAAFWAGGDPQIIDAWIRRSGLMRDKWDSPRGGTTYGELTIKSGVALVSDFYQPSRVVRRRSQAPVPEAAAGGDGTDDAGGKPRDDPPKCTDLGNGDRFAAQHGSDVRYCYAFKGWHAWDDCRWAEGAQGDVERRAKRTALSIFDEAKNAKDVDVQKALARWAITSQSSQKHSAMLAMARSEVEVTVEQLDRDPWLLNTPSGTVDLRSGVMRDHDRADLITKVTNAAYDATATCPRWLRFLEEIFGGDAELIGYVQRLAGYALAGETSEHVMLMFEGQGRNGKSTLLGALIEVMGDYAYVADSKILLSRGGDPHPADRAKLRGRRLVICYETDHERQLNEAEVKNLTGGDVINARGMYENPFTFRPTHTLGLVTNYRPEIKGKDEGIWSRIHVIPFGVKFGRDDPQCEPNLKAKLVESEGPGILRWAVEGCLAWQREGLKRPKAVVDASDAYREEMNDPDDVDRFIEELCEKDPRANEPAGELYTRYSMWAPRRLVGYEVARTATAFGRELTTKGYRSSQLGGGKRIRHGLRFKRPGSPS